LLAQTLLGALDKALVGSKNRGANINLLCGSLLEMVKKQAEWDGIAAYEKANIPARVPSRFNSASRYFPVGNCVDRAYNHCGDILPMEAGSRRRTGIWSLSILRADREQRWAFAVLLQLTSGSQLTTPPFRREPGKDRR
jgi:hypothetical protein